MLEIPFNGNQAMPEAFLELRVRPAQA